MPLNQLVSLKTTYFLPKDNLVEDVLIPALEHAKGYDIMTAFFSSRAFKELAPGLVKFVHSSNGPIRMIISPLLKKEDIVAIKSGLRNTPEVLEENFKELINISLMEESTWTKYTLECFSYLISLGRLKIKLACVKTGDLFHAKVSLLRDDLDTLVIHGSTNFTPAGLVKNVENARLERTWVSESERNTVGEFQIQFESMWFDKHNRLNVYDISEALEKEIVREWKVNQVPKLDKFLKDISKINEKQKTEAEEKEAIDIQSSKDSSTNEFIIPKSVNCWSGTYAYQGKAIEKWFNNDNRGILAMCTGAGKTITALAASHKLYDNLGHLLIYISVPYNPLLHQWVRECKIFGVSAISMANMNRQKKKRALNKCLRRLKNNVSKIEIIVGSNDALKDSEYSEILSHCDCSRLLIGDEVHNLGTDNFLNNAPEYFEFRLGLSATPEKQYDEIITQRMIDFFGPIIYRYELDEAIGNSLVPYKYHVYPVYLTDLELLKWSELTEKIKKLGWMEKDEGNDNFLIDSLRRKRRVIVEQAENKLKVFKKYFLQNNLNEIIHTLIYASDKGRNQLNEINSFLKEECKIMFHQVTGEETGTKESEVILHDFALGDSIKVLTAMRVLDEGVNIPQIKMAYLLASTTVKRQWTQRRGRVLRRCDAINKKYAVIHDFIVVAPNNEQFKALQNYEFDRIEEFSRLSMNPMNEYGGVKFLQKYRK